MIPPTEKAEQDEEDRALAMMALGHKKVQIQNQAKETAAVDAAEDLLQKQKRAGVDVLQSDDVLTVGDLPESLRAEFEGLISQGLMTATSIDAAELRGLMAMAEEDARNVVELFKGTDLTKVTKHPKLLPQSQMLTVFLCFCLLQRKQIGNKTRFLAGIMRRVEQQKRQASSESTGDQVPNKAHKNRKVQKQEQEEVDAILREEGLLDESEGSKVIATVMDVMCSKRAEYCGIGCSWKKLKGSLRNHSTMICCCTRFRCVDHTPRCRNSSTR